MSNERSPTQEAADGLKKLRAKFEFCLIELAAIEQNLSASAWGEEMLAAKKDAARKDESFAYGLICAGDGKIDRRGVISTPAISTNSIFLVGVPLAFAVMTFVVIALLQ